MRRHADRVVRRLDAARGQVTQLARQAGCRFAAPPQAMFGWVDTGVDTGHLAAVLAAEGWLVAPGSLFYTTPRRSTLMRINFASAQDPRSGPALLAVLCFSA